MKIMNTTQGTIALDWESKGNGVYRLYGRAINAVVSHRWNGREWVTTVISGDVPLDSESLHAWCLYSIA